MTHVIRPLDMVMFLSRGLMLCIFSDVFAHNLRGRLRISNNFECEPVGYGEATWETKYKCVFPLGAGGYSKVWLCCKEKGADELVAVKEFDQCDKAQLRRTLEIFAALKKGNDGRADSYCLELRDHTREEDLISEDRRIPEDAEEAQFQDQDQVTCRSCVFDLFRALRGQERSSTRQAATRVVTVTEHTKKGKQYIVTDAGRDSLRNLIKLDKFFDLMPLDKLRAMQEDLLKSIEEFHEAGFGHHDIKPANIVWFPTLGRWKLIDYDSSRHLRQCEERKIWALQTAGYLSPKGIAWMEANTVDAQERLAREMDRWSLGLCLLEAAVGKTGILKKIAEEEGILKNIAEEEEKEEEVEGCREWVEALQKRFPLENPEIAKDALLEQVEDHIRKRDTGLGADTMFQGRADETERRQFIEKVVAMMVPADPALQVNTVTEPVEFSATQNGLVVS